VATVILGGGIIAGVVYALLPRPEEGRPTAVVPESDPPFAGRDVQPDAPVEPPPPEAPAVRPGREPRPAVRRSFAALQAALAAADHLPEASLDGADAAAQEAVLCDVGDLDIAIALPSTRMVAQRPFELLCVPDVVGGRAWSFLLAEPGREPRRIGGVRVEQGRLIAGLEPATPSTVIARQAVSCAVLRIAAGDGGGAATFVQLRRPERHGPLVARRLLVATSQPAAAPGVLLPACPWPCGVAAVGRCGDLVGVTTSYRSGLLVTSGTPGSVQWTTTWSPGPDAEPFLDVTTEFACGRNPFDGPAPASVRRTRIAVRPPWSSSRRLGRLGSRVAGTGGPPTAADLEHEVAAVSRLGLTQIVEGSVSGLQLSLPRILTTARRIVQDELPLGAMASLEEWTERCGRLLAGREGYRRWAVGHPDRATARPAAARDYLAMLQPAIEAGEADVGEVALAAIIDDLDRLRAEKEAAIAIVRSLGAGDVTFTGSLYADFPDFVPGHRARSVLATFAAADDVAAPDVPVP
jgi:hypothetical protein